MDSNSEHTHSLLSSNSSKSEKQFQGSPMPKIFYQRNTTSSVAESKKNTTPPNGTILEERMSVTSSKFENELEMPPTPPNYSIKDVFGTPVNQNNLFCNIDYTGMSVKDLISRSARRVKVLENGEEVHDTTWTEVKQKINESLNQRGRTEEKSKKENENPMSVKGEELKFGENSAIKFQTQVKAKNGDIENSLRRSSRLAKIKSQTTSKRKVSNVESESKKKLKDH